MRDPALHLDPHRGRVVDVIATSSFELAELGADLGDMGLELTSYVA